MGGSMERPNLALDHQLMQANVQEPTTSLIVAFIKPPQMLQQHQARHHDQQGILQQNLNHTMIFFNK
jgi:hypothetical protein